MVNTGSIWNVTALMITFALSAISQGCQQVQTGTTMASHISPPAYMQAEGQKYYLERVAEIATQTPLKGGVLFIGDSLIEGGNWEALFPGVESLNHGVGWDTTTGVKKRLPQILTHKPAQIHIMIGTNDINYDRSAVTIVNTLSEVLLSLREANPLSQIYVQSLLPRESASMPEITEINAKLKAALETGPLKDSDLSYIDLTQNFISETGELRTDLSYDGLHLNENGYAVWASIIGRIVMRATDKS